MSKIKQITDQLKALLEKYHLNNSNTSLWTMVVILYLMILLVLIFDPTVFEDN